LLSADGANILLVSKETWRDLSWLVSNEHGALETYPAETFGPLPEDPAPSLVEAA
jgi:hypothetical protein